MRIAFVAYFDPLDRRSWSGTHYGMYSALSRHVGEVVPVLARTRQLERALGCVSRVSRKVTGRYYDATRSLALAHAQAAQLDREIRVVAPDVVFSPAGSTQLAFLKTSCPIVYSSDATFAVAHRLYGEDQRYLPAMLYEADFLERRAIERADLLLYPSRWAARSAIDDYGASPERVHVLPYGANLSVPPPREVPQALPQGGDRFRLLLVGVEWGRKGGQIALEALRDLRARGIAAELTVCGCTPPSGVDHPALTVIPFLDKNHRPQERFLEQLLERAHLLFVPSRAECFGVVFCEASAFGVPSIATDVGGVSDAVTEGVNGHLLPVSARGHEYAGLIEALARDPERYRRLRETTRQQFERQLSWDAWARAAKPLFERLLAGGLGAPSEGPSTKCEAVSATSSTCGAPRE